MSMHHVYSTLTCDNAYTAYEKQGGDMPVPVRKVIIHGGANVANKTLVTPKGVVTTVTDEDLEFLRQNTLFQQHEKGGFVTVESRATNPDKVAKDMTAKDKSAPKTPDDYPKKEDGTDKVSTGAVKPRK